MNKYWAIKNKADESAEIFIYGDISKEKWNESDVSGKSFLDELKSLNANKINLHINSAGGDVFEALAIYNTLKNFSGEVYCYIEGICASAATVISAGCTRVSMAENSLFMIHNPLVGLMGFYDEPTIDKVKNSLLKVKATLIKTYQIRTNKTDEEISELLDAETWYTAEEALENNFVDEILGVVDSDFDNAKKILYVNNLMVDCRKFDTAQIKNRIDKPPLVNAAQSYISKVIVDNLNSGAEGLADSIPHTPDKNKQTADLIAKFLK